VPTMPLLTPPRPRHFGSMEASLSKFFRYGLLFDRRFSFPSFSCSSVFCPDFLPYHLVATRKSCKARRARSSIT
jgi:hypothetical protein